MTPTASEPQAAPVSVDGHARYLVASGMPAAVITVRDLAKRYGSTIAVADVSLDVN